MVLRSRCALRLAFTVFESEVLDIFCLRQSSRDRRAGDPKVSVVHGAARRFALGFRRRVAGCGLALLVQVSQVKIRH